MAKLDVSASEEELAPAAGTKKLAIFCQSLSRFVEGFEVYVVDMDMNSIHGGEYSEINPRIRFTGGQHWEVCVLNSNVYIFEECKNKLCYIRHTFKDPKESLPYYIHPQEDWVTGDYVDCRDSVDWGDSVDCLKSGYEMLNEKYDPDPLHQSAKKYFLSPTFLDSPDTILIQDVDQLHQKFVELTPMKWPKFSPVALPTPNGKKILVFQRYIEAICPWTCFELYYPELDFWTEVEPPLFPPIDLEYITVAAYTFVDNSTFLLSTDAGIYLLMLVALISAHSRPPHLTV